MSDLISKGALLEVFEQMKRHPDNRIQEIVFLHGAMSVIDDAPIIDAVPVIRCAACSWRKRGDFCRRHGHHVREDFFCAYGTTGDVRGMRPQVPEKKKAEERCGATGLPCTKCTPGPCDHRRTVIADDIER